MTVDTVLAPEVDAWIPGEPPLYRIDRLVLVDDTDLGEAVAVRWRSPISHYAWIWKCVECGRSRSIDCQHKFTAALLLAEQLLSLQPTIPRPDTGTTQETTTP